jgi:hypothetical protein
MKRKTIYLCIAFSTFLLGTFLASFWLFNFKNNAPLNPDEVGIDVYLDSEIKTSESLLQGDGSLVRLKPAVFSQLPKSVISYLQKRGCTIPQIFGLTKPHNVIRGQFAKSNQYDWAVLCSCKRVSTILVFWNGSTKSVAEIARENDEIYSQTMNDGSEVGYDRLIEVVDRDYILDHYRAYGGKKPPQIRHQGINDIYVEKASEVHYFYRKRWLQLQGAD